jgi:hypothetical protein
LKYKCNCRERVLLPGPDSKLPVKYRKQLSK